MWKSIILITSLTAVLISPIITYAAMQHVTLEVPGMTCSSCPITVKKALSKVRGVQRVATDIKHKQANVTFDDTQTTLQKLTNATANAGYPTTIKASIKRTP